MAGPPVPMPKTGFASAATVSTKTSARSVSDSSGFSEGGEGRPTAAPGSCCRAVQSRARSALARACFFNKVVLCLNEMYSGEFMKTDGGGNRSDNAELQATFAWMHGNLEKEMKGKPIEIDEIDRLSRTRGGVETRGLGAQNALLFFGGPQTSNPDTAVENQDVEAGLFRRDPVVNATQHEWR